MTGKNYPFQCTLSMRINKAHYSPARHRRPHCKIDQRILLSCSFETFVIPLQLEIHCINAKKPVGYPTSKLLTKLGLSLSKKYGLPRFVQNVHKRQRYPVNIFHLTNVGERQFSSSRNVGKMMASNVGPESSAPKLHFSPTLINCALPAFSQH